MCWSSTRSACVEKRSSARSASARAVTMANRRLDVLEALSWLAQRCDVDAARLALLGWSNGGSTVLAATNLTHAEVAQASPPAEPCAALAGAAKPEPQLQLHSYAGAYHGFDSSAPVKLRKDVPNGVHPGQGVHVGGNAAAREASRAQMLAFLKAQLQ